MTFIGQVVIEESLYPKATGKMAYLFMSDEDNNYDYESGENAVIIQPGKIPAFINTNKENNGPTLPHEFATRYLSGFEPVESQDEMHDFLSSLPHAEQDTQIAYFVKTKLGGTPYYIQDEELPRKKGWEPLLQINPGDAPFDMNLGDSGLTYVVINQDEQ